MANRRQPPRPGSTPVRRPKVAGIRRPGAESETQSLNRPSPKPRPAPAPVEPVEPEATEVVGAETTEATEAVETAETTAAVESPVAEPEAAEPEAADAESAEDEVAGAKGAEAEVAGVETTESEAAESEVAEAPAKAAKPSPRPKARDTGVRKPSSEAEAEELAAEDEPVAATVFSPRKRGGALIALLLVAAVVFAGLAVWFKIEESEVSASTDNTALLDVAKTAQVKQAVTSAAEALFSYDFNDIAKTENAANDLLVNDEVRQKYNGFMGEVKRLAPEQKMVVTMKVTRSAVVLLDGDRAKVMVSADQTSTRTAQNQTSAGGAQMWFTTELRDGKWKITDLNTYSGGQPAQPTQPAPAPGAPPAPGN
ncbi:hypothetical protein [Amycolatopsis sp. 195334CR]|uniref:hypothetical protein n=1 Tax=Amycolatopsis sp. 195334CR TaxID=2814588 RepID=UPI001A8BF927|nr:hypothetical protein [Amycolatopsis sp. 195334CR]MBN6036283.1 hypothetical protein [Amycolatopsis sp. 195334CR]